MGPTEQKQLPCGCWMGRFDVGWLPDTDRLCPQGDQLLAHRRELWKASSATNAPDQALDAWLDFVPVWQAHWPSYSDADDPLT